jgi:hypothetical protein
MAEIIDLDHARRARRMLGILIQRFGYEHFLIHERPAVFPPRVDEHHLDDAITLAATWIERRSGRVLGATLRARMRRDLRRRVLCVIAERMVRAGY